MKQQILQIIGDCLGKNCSAEPETTRLDELDMDSIDLVEVVMALEEEFEVDIPDEECEGWETLKDLYSTVGKLKGVDHEQHE